MSDELLGEASEMVTRQKPRRVERPEWPCVAFARLDPASPAEVADFILWLSNWGGREFGDGSLWSDLDQDVRDETLYGWTGAPRKRMAKLLWQKLVGDDTEQTFERHFELYRNTLTAQIENGLALLRPVQQNLKWVLQALQERQRADSDLGQTAWGEAFWLPTDQAAYMKEQLRMCHPTLISQSSSFLEALRSFPVPYYDVPTEDVGRKYVGEYTDGSHVLVHIEDRSGRKWPLMNARFPNDYYPGSGFFWGYPGGGPSALALSILSDCFHGDFEKAEELRVEFVKEVLMKHDQYEDFCLAHVEVLTWLMAKGATQSEFDASKRKVSKLKAQWKGELQSRKERIAKVSSAGPLLSQRFDLVANNFEAALYADLMQMIQRAGWILHCSHCKHVMAADATPRGNRQRARWLSGMPVYHEVCYAEHRRGKKRSYYRARANSAEFRARERSRARSKRRRKG